MKTPVFFRSVIFLILTTALTSLQAAKLQKGDIVYADSGDAVNGGCVIKVDPQTGAQTILSVGHNLSNPFGVTLDAAGQILVSDSGRLIRIDPETGAQTVVSDNTLGALGLPYGIDTDRSGQIWAVNAQAVLRVDPLSGQVQSVSAGGCFGYPLGISVAANGDLWVANVASVSEIVRVNPRDGSQTVVSRGGFLKTPQAITVKGNDIYVADVATADGTFGIGCVIHIDVRTGNQTVVSGGGYLVGPVGIAIDENGQIVVGDPYTINPESADLYDGGVIRIDPKTGAQTLLARGHGSFVNPRGVVVVGGALSK